MVADRIYSLRRICFSVTFISRRSIFCSKPKSYSSGVECPKVDRQHLHKPWGTADKFHILALVKDIWSSPEHCCWPVFSYSQRGCWVLPTGLLIRAYSRYTYLRSAVPTFKWLRHTIEKILAWDWEELREAIWLVTICDVNKFPWQYSDHICGGPWQKWAKMFEMHQECHSSAAVSQTLLSVCVEGQVCNACLRLYHFGCCSVSN